MGERARLEARRSNLVIRGRILRAIREFFEERGYLEVETPLLVPSPGLELHLTAIATDPGERPHGRYLATSPEYQMKRLLAGGFERIYQLGRAFRAGERGAHHVPEFTILEWYRPGTDLIELMDETASLVVSVARAARQVGGVEPATLGLDRPWERLTVREAFATYGGVDLAAEPDELIETARASGVTLGTDAPWEEAFFHVFALSVEPHLGRASPTFLYEWPAPFAALSRISAKDPTVAERFELFIGGLELANAFSELLDPVEQRRRLERDAAERRRRGRPSYVIDERFLAALEEGVPPTLGIALGVDRLVMLLCGVDQIDDVLAFAPEEL